MPMIHGAGLGVEQEATSPAEYLAAAALLVASLSAVEWPKMPSDRQWPQPPLRE
jgi:hypothetical protein